MSFAHCTLLALSLASSTAFAKGDLNFPYDGRLTLFWICAGIALTTSSIMLYAIIRHHKSKEVQFHKNIWTELIWSIIPLIILTLMVIPAAQVF